MDKISISVPVGWDDIERAAAEIGIVVVGVGGDDLMRERIEEDVVEILARLWRMACTDTLRVVQQAIKSRDQAARDANAPAGRA